jgi:malonate-semialdehyde dehydrogenase (acetylating)/methylmalonate-semialdehyde dehydrogenase
MSRVALEAGFPAGAINLVHGGREINSFILEQPEIQGIGFIGSTSAGLDLFAQCGRLGKTSSLNGNGKNTVVIMPDASLESCPAYLRQGCFGMTGQRCLGSDNVVILGDKARYRQVKQALVDNASGMKLGYGLDQSVTMGPYATPAGRDKVWAWVESGLNQGAKLALDGRQMLPAEYPHGYFMGPTILEGADIDMDICKEEAFGAVAALIRADSLDQVIDWINSKTDLGHSACIMTASGASARKFAREVNVGNVGINVGVPQPYAFFPLGSKRKSFLGAAKSRMASMRLFLDEKTYTARWV